MKEQQFTFKNYTNKDDYRTREEWLELTEDWNDPYDIPILSLHNGRIVVRDDHIVGGTKSRAADLVVARAESDHLCYVVPRKGLAGVAILEAAKRHDKKVTFFMPSSKVCSDIQAYCYENADQTFFHRIASMPNLNRMAEQWANDNGAYFVPLGLKHELATAAIIRTCDNLRRQGFNPETMLYAISTGVLGRALQIGFPDTDFTAVAVARNIQEGELGDAIFMSEKRPFLTDEPLATRPPYPSVANYDAKLWKYSNPGDAIWNVGDDTGLTGDSSAIDSYRDWPKNES